MTELTTEHEFDTYFGNHYPSDLEYMDELDSGPLPTISVSTSEYNDVRHEDKSSADELDGEEESHFPGTFFVLHLSSSINHQTLSWLTNQIKKSRRVGGAELQVRLTKVKEEGNTTEDIFIHVGASISRLFEGGELMDIKKRDNEGFLREFTVKNLDLFLDKDTNSENLLTLAEKQRIVLHELENIRAKKKQNIVGYPDLVLYPGQSVVQFLHNKGIISQMYPLHDKKKLLSLGKKWYLTLSKTQPINGIREYFGEEIAIYFAFLGHYTMALVPPAIIGVIQLLSSVDTIHEYAFFAIFNLIWVTLFLESWKRNCSELAYNWGTIGVDTAVPEPRSNYHGEMEIDVVTGRHQSHYPAWKRYLKVYCVSFPIVILSIIVAVVMMFYSVVAENKAVIRFKQNPSYTNNLLVYFPSILYAVLVWMLNLIYRRLATKLTDWENHKTQISYDNHKIVKVVLFEFVNNFLSMFYIAFYIQDMEMLRWQVAVMLIIQQMVNHIQEAVIPYILRRYRSRKSKKYEEVLHLDEQLNEKSRSGDEVDSTGTILHSLIESLGIWSDEDDVNDTHKHQAIQESQLDPYEGVDDYLEVFVQFGYVFLFSSVYPLAAFWAIINNIFEIRADAFKLCEVSQRPSSKPACDIGAWQLVFELMGAVAVITNIALLSLSPTVKALAPSLSPVQWVLLMVTVEHIILFIKFLVAYLIPDTPGWVNKALQKIDYQTKQALKFERSLKTRQHLRRARMRSADVTSLSAVRRRIARGLSRD